MAVKRNRARAPVRRKAAATSDVVGSARGAVRGIPAKWRTHFHALVRARDLLLSRQTELVKDATEEAPAFSLHMADAGTDSFDRDFALSRVSSEQDAVYEIDEAINRIRDGTYGICELTGKRIERQRLAAIPWTRFSSAAEKELEKNGAVHRARLGRRQAVGYQSDEAAPVEREPMEEE